MVVYAQDAMIERCNEAHDALSPRLICVTHTPLHAKREDSMKTGNSISGRALVVVAHPDDEILWAGGTILMNPRVEWRIVSLCRADDGDRAPKFHRVLDELDASGTMGNMDDSAEQQPLEPEKVISAVSAVVDLQSHYDYVLSHSPLGEYTRHLRHEETGSAVAFLWERGELRTNNLWLFAYEDGERAYLPRAIKDAHRLSMLPQDVWESKLRIITELYGFPKSSFEAQTAPKIEGFWCFASPERLIKWRKQRSGQK